MVCLTSQSILVGPTFYETNQLISLTLDIKPDGWDRQGCKMAIATIRPGTYRGTQNRDKNEVADIMSR